MSVNLRAGLNAIPVLEEYRAAPAGNLHLLQTAMGAVAGQLTNIDLEGRASMAFHADPALLRHDPYRYAGKHPSVLFMLPSNACASFYLRDWIFLKPASCVGFHRAIICLAAAATLGLASLGTRSTQGLMPSMMRTGVGCASCATSHTISLPCSF